MVVTPQTRVSSNKNQRTSYLKHLIHNDSTPVDQPSEFNLLGLPQSVRTRIWVLLGFSYTKTLRLVCPLIKEDIDTVVGISSAIDSTFDDFPFHCTIAIRKVAIHELIVPAFMPFLKYPLSLRELEIRGEITPQNFNYILTSCPNIIKLSIIFNNFVLDQQTPMFPLSVQTTKERPLANLRSIKLVAHTKKFPELFYVYRNLISLLRDFLADTQITSIHIWLQHKVPTIFFKEMLMTTLVFVHKRAAKLRYLNLTFRDRDQHTPAEGASQPPTTVSQTPEASKAQNPPAAAPTRASKEEAVAPNEMTFTTQRRDTGVPLPPGLVITHHIKDLHSQSITSTGEDTTDIKEGEGEAEAEPDDSSPKATSGEETNDGIREAVRYLEKNSWEQATWLQQLSLTLPQRALEYLINIMSPNACPRDLILEVVGHTPTSWQLYEEFIKRCNPKNLTTVTLNSVDNTNASGKPLPLDLGIFKKSISLKRLTILCHKKEDFKKLSKARRVSSLPKSLIEITFERVLLKPCQIFRLLFCYLYLTNLSLSYWSITDYQFSSFMFILKWAVKLDLTDVHRINLVDTKIRFKNKRQAVRNLQRAVAISVRYQDVEETKLVLDAERLRDDASFAPRISVIKITKPLPKPKRINKNSVLDAASVSTTRIHH